MHYAIGTSYKVVHPDRGTFIATVRDVETQTHRHGTAILDNCGRPLTCQFLVMDVDTVIIHGPRRSPRVGQRICVVTDHATFRRLP